MSPLEKFQDFIWTREEFPLEERMERAFKRFGPLFSKEEEFEAIELVEGFLVALLPLEPEENLTEELPDSLTQTLDGVRGG